MRSPRISEEEALARMADAFGDASRARQEYLEAVRKGALDTWGRRSIFAEEGELIPREHWYRAEWLEPIVPGSSPPQVDPQSVGFHFSGASRPRWYYRELRGDQVKALLASLLGRHRRHRQEPPEAWTAGRPEAFRWLDNEGSPQPRTRDGRQVRLMAHMAEWFTTKRKMEEPPHSTLQRWARRYVVAWRAERTGKPLPPGAWR